MTSRSRQRSETPGLFVTGNSVAPEAHRVEHRQPTVEGHYASPTSPQRNAKPCVTIEDQWPPRSLTPSLIETPVVDMTMEDQELEIQPRSETTPAPEPATKFLRHSKLRAPRGQVFTKAKSSYLQVFTRQIIATSGFDIPLNTTELSLRGVRDKLSSVTSYIELMNLHTRDGRKALDNAQKLLEEEWKRSLAMCKVLRKPEEREICEERFVAVKAEKSDQCDEDVLFCEALMKDLQEVIEEGKGRLRARNAARVDRGGPAAGGRGRGTIRGRGRGIARGTWEMAVGYNGAVCTIAEAHRAGSVQDEAEYAALRQLGEDPPLPFRTYEDREPLSWEQVMVVFD